MEFQVKVLLITFILTTIFSFIIIPILKKFKIGQMERDDGPQSHLKKQGTPTMGGIIIIISIIIVCCFLYYYYTNKTLEPVVAKNIIPLLLITVGFGIIGFIDDFKKVILKNTKGLSPTAKIIGLLLVASCYTVFLTMVLKIGTDIYIPFFKTSITLPVWIYIPFAILVILSTTNAINLTDGIDGLSSSITTIILTCLTVIAIIYNVKEITLFGSCLSGACLGFLLFNIYPSKVMMGDTGSLLLGGAVAAMALYLKMPLILLIIALIPILETLSVIMQVLHFKRTGNRIFKMAPLHHHFELSGWKENKVVSVFNIITLIMCIIGILAI